MARIKWSSFHSSLLLQLVKLPLGYYRDVFVNALYHSLSALSLTVFTSSFSTPAFPSLPLSLLSPSSVLSVRFFRPLARLPLSKSHYFVNFVASRCQPDLLCKSHCTDLIPNLPQYSNELHSNSCLILVFTIPQCFNLCLAQSAKLLLCDDK